MNYHPISQANKREQQNQQDSTSGWKSSLGKICKQNSARARTSILNSARVTGQRRRKLSTRDRGYTATTVTLQTKPTKRGNTDCRRFSKIRSIEFATKPKRGKFTVKARITPSVKSTRGVSFNGLRTADQPFLRFTVSFILQWTV